MGVVTVWLVFQIALDLFPERRALALIAAALCAFNPQFTFTHAYINNDGAVTLFSTAAFWLLGRYVLGKGDAARNLAGLGCCIGLGLLTKTNAMLLLPISGIAILVRGWSRADRVRRIAVDSLIVGIPVLALSGWYFVRGAMIYGLDDPLGWELLRRQYPVLVLPPEKRWSFLTQTFPTRLFTSTWGRFDWLTIWLPSWAYWFYGASTAMAGAGLAFHSMEARGSRRFQWKDWHLALLAGAIVLFGISLILFNLSFTAAQGRLLFPVLGPLCVFMAMGIDGVFDRALPLAPKRKWQFAMGFALILAVLNAHMLWSVLRPVYAT
jgi:4-amino-4-deoxy-L-arabinose transferase-like glycosyltransferase